MPNTVQKSPTRMNAVVRVCLGLYGGVETAETAADGGKSVRIGKGARRSLADQAGLLPAVLKVHAELVRRDGHWCLHSSGVMRLEVGWPGYSLVEVRVEVPRECPLEGPHLVGWVADTDELHIVGAAMEAVIDLLASQPYATRVVVRRLPCVCRVDNPLQIVGLAGGKRG